jgi:hypothetical protein
VGKRDWIDGLTSHPIEQELKDVAAAVIDLQELRHKADYDLTETFERLEVLAAIAKVEMAMNSWLAIKSTDNARVFLSALLLHSKWNKFNK